MAKKPASGSGGESLAGVLTEETLQDMAYGKSFGRGQWCFEDGRVENIFEIDGKVSAGVRGAELYRVKLWAEGGQLGFECSCPVGADGLFCKHCVAAGLEWLERQSDGEPMDEREESFDPRAATKTDVCSYLERQSKDALVRMVLEQASDDSEFGERLAWKAVLSRDGGPSPAFLRKAISTATRVPGHVGYRAATGFAERIRTAVTPIRDMIEQGKAAEAIELTEYALRRVEKAAGQVDDSADGCMGSLLGELQNLHLDACRKARPEPEELARRLFKWEMSSNWEVFRGAAETYAEVLGEKGLACYRKLAEAVWQNVPVLKPGQEKCADGFARRFTITSMMEALARQSGDIDELARVMARDLSLAYCFLEIAQVYQEAGRDDEALEWAEKGLNAFPEETDSRLREFLAVEYHKRGRHNDAMSLVWAEFTEHPCLEHYRGLKEHAEKVGQWPTWREEALELLRCRSAAEKKTPRTGRWGWQQDSGAERLVEILLWEGDAEAAWLESQAGGLSDDLWLKLAETREKEHPADAVMVFQQHVEFLIEGIHGTRYEEVVRYLLRVGRLMARMGKREQFNEYLAAFRAKYKRKWSLMQLIDSARWP
jgi:uncharacterized Zn finger protein